MPIVKRTADWFDKLNSSRFIVNNYGGIWGLTKSRATLSADLARHPVQGDRAVRGATQGRSTERIEQIKAEAADWDAFVSQSPYLSAMVPSEFAFHGTLLETGYPRNDRLITASASEREAIRERLGVHTAAEIMLYAPTFRESMRDGWRADLYEGLDVSRLAALLGPDWRILLRGHSFTARDDHVDRSADLVVDVTRERDINDLYLASDVLVTDYSSVMFDYAVTRKPMAFFTPDIKQYVATRGVYFDLAEVAPGPLCTTMKQLADEVRDLGALSSKYVGRAEAFRERFAPWDDGKAAARVVDAFFSDVTD